MLAATTVPRTPPGPTHAPDLGTAVEHDSTPKPGIPKEVNLPSINRSTYASTSIMTTPISQYPSPPPATDSDGTIITGCSPQELNAENTGDRPPHLSHGCYDIV